MAPIPILVCAKGGPRAQEFLDEMLPEYKVLAVVNSVATAKRDLPGLLAGEAATPESGLGSYASDTSAPEKPRAVIVGGGFSADELKAVREVAGAESVPWFKGNPALVDRSRFPEGSLPPTHHMVERCKAVMQREGVEAGKGAGEVFDF